VAEVNDNQRREFIWEAREYLDPRVHEAEPEGAAYIEALARELEVALEEKECYRRAALLLICSSIPRTDDAAFLGTPITPEQAERVFDNYVRLAAEEERA
jgi:hypothetical protein